MTLVTQKLLFVMTFKKIYSVGVPRATEISFTSISRMRIE
jgi:hypothetical protein